MSTVFPTLPLPHNPLADSSPAETIGNVRDVLALLSALDIGSDAIRGDANSGFWFVLCVADEALKHAEAILEQKRLADNANSQGVAS